MKYFRQVQHGSMVWLKIRFSNGENRATHYREVRGHGIELLEHEVWTEIRVTQVQVKDGIFNLSFFYLTNEIWTHFSVYFLNLYESVKPTENSFSGSLIGSSYRVTFLCYFYPLKWPPLSDVPETGITWSVQLTSALSDSPIVCQSNIKRPNQIILYRIMIHSCL